MAIRNTTQIAQPVGPAPELPSLYPEMPEKLAKIDPGFVNYHLEAERLYRRIREALAQQNSGVAKAAAETVKRNGELSTELVRLGTTVTSGDATLSAAILAEAGIRETEDGLLATSISILSSSVDSDIADVNALITSEQTARADADTALASDITSLSSSVNGQIATINSTLSTQATFNGQISATYTLTATAGDVITGMRLLSSSGPAGNVSSVIFQADRFAIYNGTSGTAVFDLNGSSVRIGGVTIDSLSATKRLYIGVGNFNNADTSFYVDSTGKFSLKDKLSWDGTTLAITGAVTATSGAIGGISLAADKMYLGTGTYNDAATPFYVDNTGRFSLSNKFAWSGTALSLSGSLTVTSNDGLNVTGLGGRIELLSFPSSVAPSVIRFYDAANTLRSTINSDGTIVSNDSAGNQRVLVDGTGIVLKDAAGVTVTTLSTTTGGGLPAGYGPEEWSVCINGSPGTRNFITDNPD
jgi:hypothetical protein